MSMAEAFAEWGKDERSEENGGPKQKPRRWYLGIFGPADEIELDIQLTEEDIGA